MWCRTGCLCKMTTDVKGAFLKTCFFRNSPFTSPNTTLQAIRKAKDCSVMFSVWREKLHYLVRLFLMSSLFLWDAFLGLIFEFMLSFCFVLIQTGRLLLLTPGRKFMSGTIFTVFTNCESSSSKVHLIGYFSNPWSWFILNPLLPKQLPFAAIVQVYFIWFSIQWKWLKSAECIGEFPHFLQYIKVFDTSVGIFECQMIVYYLMINSIIIVFFKRPINQYDLQNAI